MGFGFTRPQVRSGIYLLQIKACDEIYIDIEQNINLSRIRNF